jgi:adenylate cyclase
MLEHRQGEPILCDGLAAELINALARLPNLNVASCTSAFRFRGGGFDIREIGRQLNVRTILEGSIRRSGNRLRISAQLINVADGYHLWSERYDRQMEDVFEIQDEIAESIAKRASSYPSAPRRIKRSPTMFVLLANCGCK